MNSHQNSNAVYQDADYWDKRYQEEDSFEWCCDTSQWSSFLEEIVPKDFRLLVLGCGNSNMSADLYKMGYNKITNIDFSPAVIEKMAEKYRNLEGMDWRIMDMFDLTFPPASFDCVIEKCTLEVLFVKERSPWDPSENAMDMLRKVMQESQLNTCHTEMWRKTSSSN